MFKQDVDTALVKLYAKDSPEKLAQYLKLSDLSCDMEDIAKVLAEHKRHHGLALVLQRQASKMDKALGIWADILAGKYEDQTFPGLEFYSRQVAK